MSYRGVKRVLGESNLERKCRRLFGASLLVLITGSFYVFSVQNDQIVFERNQYIGEALANSAVMEAHYTAQEKAERPDLQNVDMRVASELRRSRKYEWAALHPQNKDGLKQPQTTEEWALMKKWTALGAACQTDEDVEKLKEGSTRPWSREVISTTTGVADAASGRSTAKYRYYEPFYATSFCMKCHNNAGVDIYWPDMKIGDLIAIVRVDTPIEDTLDAQANARALLITLGIATVFLAMLSLWAVVRYVIVKPLTHIRDVSDAVRSGEIEQRAVIHTGDEFEEVAAAFNRMVRQLLRQQDELKEVNGELDGKIDELAQVNMRLFEMNKVKSDFLATVSHELRTPLNSILGFSDLLAKAQQLDDKQRRYAGNIERSGRQLLDMINDILDLAKIESGRMEIKPTMFDIGAVVLTQCDLARPLSERKHIELDCEIAAELPPIRQDQGKIEQVLNNLLSNAIKFTPDGGRIHVSARKDRRGDLRLIVADTGVGISESEQVAVFEKFRQGSNVLAGGNAMTREYSGTGLGLSIVRELCRLLGGDVTLESEVGKGSEFTVILPWTLADQQRIESPLAEELRQLTLNRTDGLMATASRSDVGRDI